MNPFLYRYKGAAYLNLTNRCPTACSFCVKERWNHRFGDRNLRLEREPDLSEVIEALEEPGPAVREVVFCGFGEPTYRLDLIQGAGAWVRGQGGRTRLDTTGLGDLIHGRSIAPELAGGVDAVSVSLNTADPAQWQELMRPAPAYRSAGHAAVLRFLEDCARAGLETTATAVALPDVDLEAVRELAELHGARFRARPLLEPAAEAAR